MSEETVQMTILDIEDAGLISDPDNMNDHNKKNLDAIKQSVDETGYMRGIVVDEDNIIRAGNGTYEVAKQTNAKFIIVDVDDPNTLVVTRRKGLSKVQKIRAGAWDNEAARLAKRNDKTIRRLVKDNPDQMLLEGIYSEKEQQRILKDHEDAQELGEGGAEPIQLTTDAPDPVTASSATRMIPLVLTVETVPVFNQTVKRIGHRCFPECPTITDIVLAIVKRAELEWAPVVPGKSDEPEQAEDTPCEGCGQSGPIVGGEYECAECGRATLHDESSEEQMPDLEVTDIDENDTTGE